MPDFVGTLKTPRLAAAPSAPVVGQLYFNTGDNKLYYWNGSIWVAASGGSTVIDDTNLPARLSSTSLSIGDWNNATSNGWYFSGSVPNAPIQGYWLIGHVSTGNTGIIQNVWLRDLDQQWTRRYTTNPAGWTAWKQVPVIDDTTLPPRLTSINNTAPPGNDCNNAWEAGWYTCSPATNAPGNGWGYLTVMPWAGQTGTVYQGQMFIQLGTNIMFFRTNYGNSWTSWAQIYPIDNNGLPVRLKRKTSMNVISDCNLAGDSGWYHCGTGTNAPVSNLSWNLLVLSFADGGTNWTQQFAISSDSTSFYFRTRGWNGWSAWMQIYGGPIIPPSTRVFRTTSLTLATSSWTTVSFDSERYDIGNQWVSGSPTRLTCQMAGTYGIWGQVIFRSTSGAGAHRIARIMVNGNSVGDAGITAALSSGGQEPRAAPSATVRLNVGDYAELQVYQDSGGNIDLHHGGGSEIAAYGWTGCELAMALLDGAGPPGPKGDPGPAGAAGATYSLPGRLGTAAQQLPGGGYTNDWNSAVDNGWYMSSDASNAPQGGWLLGQTINHNGIWCRQEVHAFTDGSNVQPRWSRRQNGGTWGPWVQINPNVGPPDSGWIQTDINTGYYGFYPAPYGPVYYRKLGNGMVTMRGLFTLPYQAPTYANFCTLPVGCRPSQPVYFRAACANNSALVISVNVDGQILPDATTPSGSWISMGCVNFFADQ